MERTDNTIQSLEEENKRLKRYIWDVFFYIIEAGLHELDPIYGIICDGLAKELKRDKVMREDEDTRSFAEREIGNLSDGYHTFNELYDHRSVLLATIMNSSDFNNVSWKSRKHADGSSYEGFFICGIHLPKTNKAITYHVKDKDWELFHVKELPTAPEWDGHTPDDVVNRFKDEIVETTSIYQSMG